MAGLFDFKSAEDILQERRAATKANQQELLNTIVAAAPKESRQASMLGAQLGIALGRAMGAKAEKEQLTEFRDMGETTQAMEQAGVGGEGSAQFDGEGSSYGAGVLQQAKDKQQSMLDELPLGVGKALEEEKQAKQLEQAFQNVDMDDPKATAELVKLAVASGNTKAASLAVSFNKNALEKAKGTAPDTKLGKLLAEQKVLAAQNPEDPKLALYDSAIKAEVAAKPGTLVNISNIDESEDQKQRAKLGAARYDKALEKGDAAAETLYTIDVMRNIDFKTGDFEETKFKVGSILKKFGVDLPPSFADIEKGQALRSMSEQMVNKILMAATGVQTEGDASRARKVVASLGDTPGAFAFKLNLMEGIALRERAKADFLRERVVGQKMSTEEADQEWREWMKETPQMSDSLENPGTGLPLLYHEFVNITKKQNTTLTPDEINNLWRKEHAR